MSKIRPALSVMAGLVPAIHAVRHSQSQRVCSGLLARVGGGSRKIPIVSGGSPTWMTGTSPVMTARAEISPALRIDAWDR